MTENKIKNAIEVFEKPSKHIKGVHKCENGMEFLTYSQYLVSAFETAIEGLKELEQYRAIGTPEECRAAAEKQKTKRADLSVDGHSDGDMVCGTYECPYCGEYYELGYDEYEYCPNCGQHMKIDLEGDGNE